MAEVADSELPVDNAGLTDPDRSAPEQDVRGAVPDQCGAEPDGPGADLEQAGTELDHPVADEIELGTVLHALSDPMRLRIVAALSNGAERTCKSFDLPVVKSTCTHHFRVLREAGVIRQRLEGTTRLNSLRREDLDWRFPGLLDAVLEAAETPQAR